MQEKTYWEIHDKDIIAVVGGGLLRKVKQVLRTARLSSAIFHKATGYSPFMKGSVIVRLHWDQWVHARFARGAEEGMKHAPLTCHVSNMPLLDKAIELAEGKERICAMIFKERGIYLDGGNGDTLSLDIPYHVPLDPPPIRADEGEVVHEDDTWFNKEVESAAEDGLYHLLLVDEGSTRIIRMAEYDTVNVDVRAYPRTMFNPCMLVGRSSRGDLRAVKGRSIVVRRWEPRGALTETCYSFEITTQMGDYEVEQKFLTIFPA